MNHDRSPKNACADPGNAEDEISRSLKRVYDEIADEPIPDSLQSLLDRLKQDRPRG